MGRGTAPRAGRRCCHPRPRACAGGARKRVPAVFARLLRLHQKRWSGGQRCEGGGRTGPRPLPELVSTRLRRAITALVGSTNVRAGMASAACRQRDTHGRVTHRRARASLLRVTLSHKQILESVGLTSTSRAAIAPPRPILQPCLRALHTPARGSQTRVRGRPDATSSCATSSCATCVPCQLSLTGMGGGCHCGAHANFGRLQTVKQTVM